MKNKKLSLDKQEVFIINSDEYLAKNVINGKYFSYKRLFNRYKNKIYNFAYSLTENKNDAANITEETFLRVFEALPKIQRKLSFSNYLYRNTKNLTINKTTKDKSNYKALLILKDVENKNSKEISEIMDIPNENLNNLLKKSRSKLKQFKQTNAKKKLTPLIIPEELETEIILKIDKLGRYIKQSKLQNISKKPRNKKILRPKIKTEKQIEMVNYSEAQTIKIPKSKKVRIGRNFKKAILILTSLFSIMAGVVGGIYALNLASYEKPKTDLPQANKKSPKIRPKKTKRAPKPKDISPKKRTSPQRTFRRPKPKITKKSKKVFKQKRMALDRKREKRKRRQRKKVQRNQPPQPKNNEQPQNNNPLSSAPPKNNPSPQPPQPQNPPENNSGNQPQ